MKITQKDVAYVANLANLDLTDQERVRMEKDLNAILEYVDQLAEVDTSNVAPMAQVSQLGGAAGATLDPLRADEHLQVGNLDLHGVGPLMPRCLYMKRNENRTALLPAGPVGAGMIPEITAPCAAPLSGPRLAVCGR